MRVIIFYIAILSSWYAYCSNLDRDTIYQRTSGLASAYTQNDCVGNYNGQFIVEETFLQCKEIYRQFFDLLGLASRSDGFSEYIKHLWISEDIVFSEALLFRSAIAAYSARLSWIQRPYLSDQELEKMADYLVRDAESTQELLINGLLIFGNLGGEKYIDVLKNAALNNSQRVAVVAVFSLSQVIESREQLKVHLRDIYEQTESDSFRRFLNKYVEKRGGW
ncbi:hypothetical protein QQ213_004466 [Vibrio vulnificus]|nr:hypothetical protein [Vibrio vulnificus]